LCVASLATAQRGVMPRTSNARAHTRLTHAHTSRPVHSFSTVDLAHVRAHTHTHAPTHPHPRTCDTVMVPWSRSCPGPPWWGSTGVLWLAKLTSLPPNPKDTPQGRFIHWGALRRGWASPEKTNVYVCVYVCEWYCTCASRGVCE